MNSSKIRTRSANGFTLVELLLVISIIAILSSLSLVVLRAAQEDAKVAATKARMVRVQAVLTQRMEDYQVRRIPLRLSAYGLSRDQMMQVRKRILAEIMNAEMPGQTSDVNQFPSANFNTWLSGGGANDLQPPMTAANASTLVADLQVQEPALVTRLRDSGVDDANYGSAEYLYQILLMTDYDDARGIEVLGNAATSNLDPADDSAPEVIDSFGEPLEFEMVFDNGTATQPFLRDIYNAPNINFEIEDVRFRLRSLNVPDETIE